MNTAYRNMRHFWLYDTITDTKADFPALGENQISIAGIEFCMSDGNNVIKNIFIAGSTLKDASMYFENNSPSGIGGFLGTPDKETLHPPLKAMLEAAAKISPRMDVVRTLPPAKLFNTTFFAVAKNRLYARQLSNDECMRKNAPFNRFFISAQNMISAFREADENNQ
ncbi:MAG: hypothetical protein FWF35_01300 [Elusimicrobia bacterium]|nr:hypothetical protein [Elusimicrobiota bacterium]